MNNLMKVIAALMLIMMLICSMGCKKETNNGNSNDPIGSFTVTFDANGGVGEMDSQVFTKGRQQALRANSFTREYHNFVNWNTEVDGCGSRYDDLQRISVSNDMTLFAQWEMATYTVQIVSNGGVGDMLSQVFIAGEVQALSPNLFVWDNHIFLEWNTNWDGSGTSYIDAQEITIEENITLYAQWIAALGQHGGHYYIDLGLPSGTKWALTNIGSDTPEGYGDYFAWGETVTKPDVFNQAYTPDNYNVSSI